MTVAILGAGMSGWMAALALERVNKPFVIYAREVPDGPSGSCYLHDACGLPIPQLPITVHFVGHGKETPELAYARKMQTSPWEVRKAWNTWVKPVIHGYCWDHALSLLTARYRDRVKPVTITCHDLQGLLDTHEAVVSTIPLPVLFPATRDLCRKTTRYFSSRTPDLSGEYGVSAAGNIIVFNCCPEEPWYRYHNIDGHVSLELLKSESDATPFMKLETNVTFKPEDGRILLAGRLAEWNKDRLAHEVYYRVRNKFLSGQVR